MTTPHLPENIAYAEAATGDLTGIMRVFTENNPGKSETFYSEKTKQLAQEAYIRPHSLIIASLGEQVIAYTQDTTPYNSKQFTHEAFCTNIVDIKHPELVIEKLKKFAEDNSPKLKKAKFDGLKKSKKSVETESEIVTRINNRNKFRFH